ncbi:hypothetical protein [Thomasclavelia cocleata]|uniref:hypothetical protein n=1 Tax=Thomasclavelia cocleata TaxID=69824 RepID=UPI002570CB11|nr:hypothetical protein [Thomasclavelia cocleata]
MDYDCLLSEINVDCRLFDKMDKAGIKLIDVDAGCEIRKAIGELPIKMIELKKQ